MYSRTYHHTKLAFPTKAPAHYARVWAQMPH